LFGVELHDSPFSAASSYIAAIVYAAPSHVNNGLQKFIQDTAFVASKQRVLSSNLGGRANKIGSRLA
jgi:hypothetical protein